MKKKRLMIGLVAMAAVTGVASLTACDKPKDPVVEVQNYEITFNSNGGSVVSAKTTAEGKISAPTAPTKDGYTFAGWYESSNLSGSAVSFDTKVFTANTTLYAKWTAVEVNSYTITANLYTGATALTITVNKDADGYFTPQKPADPTREYYTFDKWYSNAECTTEFDWTQSLTANTTIYAGWKGIYETVTTTVKNSGDTPIVSAGSNIQYKQFNFAGISSLDTKNGVVYDGSVVNKDNYTSATTSIGTVDYKVMKVASADITVKLSKGAKFTIALASGGSANKFNLFGEDKAIFGKNDGITGYDTMYMEYSTTVEEEGTYTITFPGTVRVAYMTIEESLQTGPISNATVDVKNNDTTLLIGRDYSKDSVLLNLNYENGRVDSVYASDCDFDLSKIDKTTAGVYEVTVSYQKGEDTYTTKYNVEYLAPAKVSYYTHIQAKDKVMNKFKTVYKLNETIDYTNLTVVFYATDSKNVIHEFIAKPSEFDASAVVTSTAGVKTITFTTSLNSEATASTINVIVVDEELKSTVKVDASLTTDYVKADAGALTFKTIDYAYQYLSLLKDEEDKVLEIAEGKYTEKLYINIPNLTIKGLGSDNTKVVINEGYYSQMVDVLGHTYSTRGSATVFVTEKAENFRMENLTVENDQNTTKEYWALRAAGISSTQGVALYTAAVNGTYYNCRFSGYHDTLEVDDNNNYFEKCYIEGRTDFIFGYTANAYFYDCEIHTLVSEKSATDDSVSEEGGYIIATNPTDNSTAFVFNGCKFTSDATVIDGSVTIGRAWSKYTTVVIMNSEFGKHISKEAFTGSETSLKRYVSMSGNVPGEVSKLIEYNNTGDGAITESQTYDVANGTETTSRTTVTVATEASAVENYSSLAKFYPNWVFDNSKEDTNKLSFEGVYTGSVSTIAEVNKYLQTLTMNQWSNKFTLPEFSIDGLTVVGVYKDAACTDALTATEGVYEYTITDSDTIKASAEAAGLYVKFVDNAVTVTYNTNGGTLVVGGETTTDITVDYTKGDSTITLATASKDGATFKYWTTVVPVNGAYESAPTEFEVPTTGLSKNITLYAYFVEIHTVTYSLVDTNNDNTAWTITGSGGISKIGAAPGLATNTDTVAYVSAEKIVACASTSITSYILSPVIGDGSKTSVTIKALAGTTKTNNVLTVTIEALDASGNVVGSVKAYGPKGKVSQYLTTVSEGNVSDIALTATATIAKIRIRLDAADKNNSGKNLCFATINITY